MKSYVTYFLSSTKRNSHLQTSYFMPSVTCLLDGVLVDDQAFQAELVHNICLLNLSIVT